MAETKASHLLKLLSTHKQRREHCKEFHPDWDTNDCAEIYYLQKRNSRYDRLGAPPRTLFEFGGQVKINPVPKYAPHFFLYVGFLLHMLQIRFSESKMIGTMVAMNLLFSIPVLCMPFDRFGTDYLAYIEQAAQVHYG